MSLSINTNVASLGAQRSASRTQGDLSTAIARLASGLRINSAQDDAAGLAIADRFTAQLRGLDQAARNANDGISLAQTAEGAIASIGANLQRMRELAVQSASAGNSASDRASLQLEVAQLKSEIDRVASQTAFNGINLLDGSFTAQAFQVGADAGQTITLDPIASTRTAALGVYDGLALRHVGLNSSGDPTHPNYYSFAVSIGGAAPISLGMVTHDGKVIAKAINDAHIAGLSTSTEPAYAATGASAANATGPGTAVYTLNGVAISLAGVDGAGALASNRATAVAAINAQQASTGVVATDTGSGIALMSPDGRTIYQDYVAGSFTNSNGSDFGLYPAANTGAYLDRLDYLAPAGVSGDLVFYFNGTPTTFSVGQLGSLGTTDISTVAGANVALASIDVALAGVSSARASLGAAQNRFASTVQNLQATTENVAASRSRIVDADFALESANLSRAQVLQQAGMAMVAQANQQPQRVLELLR